MITQNQKQRVYKRSACAVFFKTKDVYGGLSNMAGGYPLTINGITVATTEAMFQACRYPNNTGIQRKILQKSSPLVAKWTAKSRARMKNCRKDWDAVCDEIMYWCLRVKLATHYETFGKILDSTGRRSIVEETGKKSRSGCEWGTIPDGPRRLKGNNKLGRMLMMLREEYRTKTEKEIKNVPPPRVENFLIYGKPILKHAPKQS